MKQKTFAIRPRTLYRYQSKAKKTNWSTEPTTMTVNTLTTTTSGMVHGQH